MTAVAQANLALRSPLRSARRVLFVDHTAALGGGELALHNLVRKLDRRRVQPVVAVFSDGPLVQRLRQADIETHILPLNQAVLDTRKDVVGVRTLLKFGLVASSLRHAATLKDFIRRRNIEIVHTNSLKAALIGGLAARAAQVPLIWHVRDRITDDYLPPTVARAIRWLSRIMPDVVIANSQATLATLRLCDRHRSAVVYSGIDLDAYPRPGDAESNNQFDPARGATIALVGRIAPWKGQHIFLRAAQEVLKTFPWARFQIIGAVLFSEREYEHKVRQMASQLGIQHAVEFAGFRDDVAQRLRAVHILVHASVSGEPFGQVIVEGMAAGKAVVATNGGGVPEIVVHGETGLLVPMDDPTAMADAICALLRNPAWSTHLGRLGRARVLERFTADRSARDVEAVYDRMENPLPHAKIRLAIDF